MWMVGQGSTSHPGCYSSKEKEMQTRTHQGETLSEIGIGCYALSGVYGKKEPGQFAALLRRAYELGVTFFDTAGVYGPAEEVLGRAVAPFRDKVWIATKVGARPDGSLDCSAAAVHSSCGRSLQQLQTDYIDLYQIHFDDPNTPPAETVEALEALKTEGKIRYYGVGHLAPPRLEAYLAIGEPFSALAELNGASRRARDRVLPLCREHGLGMIAFSVTGRGLLTGKIRPGHVFAKGDIRGIDPLFQRERFASGLRVAEAFRDLGFRYGKTPVQVAIAWVLAQPGVICALTGPSTIAHLEENLQAAGWSMDPQELAELERLFDREDSWVQEEQARNVRGILEGESEVEDLFADLVYVLEAVVEMELAEEKQILPFFQRLWALRGRRDVAACERMQRLQADLRDRYLPALVGREAPS
jgi:aryl-alcohol dehydrogenase-like predicted oxidoreductase